VAKLNKEYEVNEGIGGGFGEFLMDLDDLTSGILGKTKSRKSLYSEKKNSKEQIKRKAEEEQEDEDENEGGEDNEEDEGAMIEEGQEEEDGSEAEEEEEDENDYVDENEDEEETQKDKAPTPFTYKPIAGEDIYGRVVDPNSQSSSAPSKYVPPGRRNLQNSSSSSSSSATVGTLSEKDLLLKRKLKGLLNKISEQSKDSILRELKQHYEQSSHNLTNEILLDSMIEMSTTTTASKLVNLIPLYASILSSLYFHVSSDIIYYSIERIFMKILWYCRDFMEKLARLEERRGNNQEEENEEDFTASHHRPVYNLLLFLLYFYNFRVFHHSFIVELMNGILQENDKNPFFTTSDHSRKEINEMKMELLECIIYHASDALRHDDPMVMKQLAQELSQKMKSTLAAKENEREGEGEGESDYSRLQFLYECVHDQMNSGSRSHNNRMKKIKEPILAFIQEKRKWLGNNKKMLGNKMGDIVVRLTISDLLNVETQGRWWKTGASWIGRQQQQLQDSEQQKQKQGTTTRNREPEESSSSSSSASLLIKKAAKENRMNTPIRQSIFEQIMLSRDILDAYERIMKLSITGKNDREIIRVLIECCLIEKTYNSFYKELMKLFSEYNRQYKMTIQYLLWDVIKRLLDEDNDNSDDEDDEDQKKGGKLSQRQILNLGRLSSDLIESFVIPLSALFKILDISAITENTSVQLYLMTFFVQLFSTKTLDVNTLQTICDRIATTPDYRQVCDHLLCFLEVSELILLLFNSPFFLNYFQ
jgi:nucleolar MIF4G domain-containing protein 1